MGLFPMNVGSGGTLSDVFCNVSSATMMFLRADGSYIGLVSSLSNDSGEFLTINGTTTNLTIKAKKACSVQGFMQPSGVPTATPISGRYSAGDTIASGNLYILIKAY